MNLSPNQHNNDSMAVLGGNAVKCSLTVSEGASATPKKANGDGEGLPPLFDKTDVCLNKRKEGKICLLINCQTICDRFDLWLVYLYQEISHNA